MASYAFSVILFTIHPSRSPSCESKTCHGLLSSLLTTRQKSDTLPLKLQSPSDHFLTGSLFGPPCSPVVGLTSPSNSEATGLRASGCSASSASASSLPTDVCERGACALRTRSSNSRWSSLGSGGGEGRFSEFDLDWDDEKRGFCMHEGERAAFRSVLCWRGALRTTRTTNPVSPVMLYRCIGCQNLPGGLLSNDLIFGFEDLLVNQVMVVWRQD